MTGLADSSDNTTLIVGTRRGLFRVIDLADRWHIDAPCIEGHEILHVCVHPQDPRRLYAAGNHMVWGAHIYVSYDGGAQWSALASAPQPVQNEWVGGRKGDSFNGGTLKAIWYLAWSPDGGTLYAGIDPAALFASVDEGQSWQPVEALNQHPTKTAWEPSKGIFAVHSIVIDPFEPSNMYAAVSAGGVYRSVDGGDSWQPANKGVRAENLPQTHPEVGHNVHRLIMHPAEPQRLYRQCYSGVYRSDDGARSWIEITGDVPSDYGFAVAADPMDADTVFRIPMSNSHMRATVDGRLRVYRSDDAGEHWNNASVGLPQQHAYVGVLREAMATVRAETIDKSVSGYANENVSGCCGVYFGTSGGHLFASRDGANSWEMVAAFLPPISSVLALKIPAGQLSVESVSSPPITSPPITSPPNSSR